MDVPLLAGLLASCSAIGALAGIRHQHLSTLIREETNKLQTMDSDAPNFADKVSNIQVQIDIFCKRNSRLRYGVAFCIVAVIALLLFVVSPIDFTQSEKLPIYVAVLGLAAALLFVSLEFFHSQHTLDLELLLTKTYIPSARFVSREKRLEKLKEKYFSN